MRYKVKQKVFSFGDDFTIKDSNDYDQFIVKGKVFSLGDKLKVTDMEGNEVANIEQQLMSFLPKYHIYVNDQIRATVKKELSFFKPKFSIESSTGNYSIEGNVISHDFNILKNGKPVAVVNKEWFAFSDTYGVDIADDEDQGFILSLVIVIDQTLHDKNN
ncbi:LURP-one-related/scramblase family protein [Dethiothermospora halolimnae]|uniref:LURP-one-related/scramblase family protein n=1 Tax=Dethiothermospora halolimnae TaxID=3114390 RepID=UPI003CCC2DC9